MNARINHCVRIALVLGAAPLAVVAQDVDTSEDIVLEDVVVTAQKVEESLSDVPISVEAVLGDKLADVGILRLDDLKAYVPNLQMSETGIANNIYIRGIGSGLNQGFEQSVSLFQDGVYHGRGHQSRMPFVDLARVEVLRGPQPILFGKNAVAGAVNMVANTPTREFLASGRVARDIENDETTAELVVSGPFTDSLRGRMAVFHRNAEGYIRNATFDTREPRRNDVGARLMLEADLGSALTATLRVEGGKFDSDGRHIEIFGETPTPVGSPIPGATYSQILANVIQLGGGTPPPGLLEPGGASVNHVRGSSSPNFSNNDSREAALTLNYHFGNGSQLTSLTAWSSYELEEGCDCDFVAAPLITAGITEDYKQYSQELRLTSSPDSRLQWIGGVYFQKYELEEFDFLRVPTNSLVPALVAQMAAPLVVPALQQAGNPCDGLSTTQCLPIARAAVDGFYRGSANPREFSQDSTMYSAFLQGRFAFNDKWSLTAGGRLSHEKKEGRRYTYLTDAAGAQISNPLALGLFDSVLGIAAHDIRGSRKETNFSPLVNVQYRASDRSMAYVSLSRGYKSGGFDARSNRSPAYVDLNPSPPVEQPGTFEFEDERATTFEVGLKTDVGRRAELNLAAFQTDYKDLQTSAFDGRIGFNVGNGSAEVRGVELEGRWRPVRALLLQGSMAVLEFNWKSYAGQCSYDLLLGGPSAGCVNGNADYRGRTNQFAPKISGVLSAEYSWALGPLVLTAGADMIYSDDYLQSLNLDPVLVQDAYTKLNARLALGHGDGLWEVAVVGRNLTDKSTVTYAADVPLAFTLFRARSYYGFVEPPRAIAIEARMRF
ncbi:MAG TPA: TonB-dependent receptor [Steroidobacteraceae bacterium]|nr:TonB-dependent receptor [Steroidobacteraceae bacterium]